MVNVKIVLFVAAVFGTYLCALGALNCYNYKCNNCTTHLNRTMTCKNNETCGFWKIKGNNLFLIYV